ncbi:MAG: imidazolonepropionase, partial [Fervidobacterium sp.]
MFIINADRLLTPTNMPSKGRQMKEIEEIFDVDIILEKGQIIDVRQHKSADISVPLVTPGFFDAHTHIPFIGKRSKEFLMRARGKGYLEILQAGGGIHYTAKLVKETSEEVLYETAERYIRLLTSLGVVGLECKSGYGLDKENELKQLRVIKKLKK